jgi:bifunctional pyridoxal-dependent enzyme with beta-cystathionase and maltose regulon repressor activities
MRKATAGVNLALISTRLFGCKKTAIDEMGKGFMRMNIAVNKGVLEQVLLQLEAAK